MVTPYPASSLTLTSQEICAIANNIITIANLIRNVTVMDGMVIIPSFSMIGNRVVSTVTSMVLSLQIINTISLLLTSCGASSILSNSHLSSLDTSTTSSILCHSASSSADTHPEYCSGTPPANADDGGQKESSVSKSPPSCQIKRKQQRKRLATSMIPNKPAVKRAKGERGSGLPKLRAREAGIMVNLSEIPQSVLPGYYATESCSAESSQDPPSCQIKRKRQCKGSFTSTTPDDKAGKYKPAVKRARGRRGSGLPEVGAKKGGIMVNLSELPQSVVPGDYATESCSGESNQGHLSASNSSKKHRQMIAANTSGSSIVLDVEQLQDLSEDKTGDPSPAIGVKGKICDFEDPLGEVITCSRPVDVIYPVPDCSNVVQASSGGVSDATAKPDTITLCSDAPGQSDHTPQTFDVCEDVRQPRSGFGAGILKHVSQFDMPCCARQGERRRVKFSHQTDYFKADKRI